MKNLEETEDIATRKEAARYMKVPERVLRKWEREHKGPPVMRLSPKRARYRWADLRAFLEASLKVTPANREAAIKAGIPGDGE